MLRIRIRFLPSHSFWNAAGHADSVRIWCAMFRHLLWALKQETSASQSQSQEAPDSIIISRPALPSMSFILLGRVHNLSPEGGGIGRGRI